MRSWTILLLCLFVNLSVATAATTWDDDFTLVPALDTIELSEDDSLLIVEQMQLYHAAEHDTLKLEVLESLIDNCWNDEVWPHYNQLLRSIADKGIANSKKGTRENSRYYYYKAVSYGNEGYLYDIQGDFNKATEEYAIALGLFTIAGAEDGQGKILNALAMVQENRGDLLTAIDRYNQALLLCENSNDLEGMGNALINIARLHNSLNNYEAGRETYSKALEVSKKIDNKRLIGYIMLSQAVEKHRNGKDAEAEELAKEGIMVLDSTGADSEKTHGLALLGYLAFIKGDADQAEAYYQELYDIAYKNRNYENLSMAYVQLADLKLAQQKLDSAEYFAQKAFDIAMAVDVVGRQSVAAQTLAQIFKAKGDLDKAYQYMETYTQLKDSINRDNYKQQALRQSFQYEYDKKKALDDADHAQEIAIQEEAQARQRLIIFGVVVLSLVIALALFIIWGRLRIIRQQKQKLDLAYEELEERKNDEVMASNLRALRSQMNPHFIFNALNSIQTLVLKGDVDSSYSYINTFAGLIRKTLAFSQEEFVPLDEELKLCETYLSLEKLRFRDDFDYDIIVPSMPALAVPPMLLQPFIENALKHGLFHKSTDRYLSVEFVYDGKLTCIITDNGIGREASKEINLRRNTDHKSFAIDALRKRFRFMQKHYQHTIGFDYEDLYDGDKATGTRVTVVLPTRSLDRSDRSLNTGTQGQG